MKNLKKITDELWVSGQPTEEALRTIGGQFRTVVNLRTADENGVLPNEERLVEDAGLNYAPIPVTPVSLDDAAVERFSQAVSSTDSTPALIHCQGGGRAGVLTLLHLAVTNGWRAERALLEGEALGIGPAADSPYRAFFEDYLRRHSAGER